MIDGDDDDDDDGIEEGLLSRNRLQYRTIVVCTGKRWLMISSCQQKK